MKLFNKFNKYTISILILFICIVFFIIVDNPIRRTLVHTAKISSYNLTKLLAFASHSYSYTESYEFDLTRKELATAIFKFRELNPNLLPPSDNIFSNQPYDFNDIFSHIYFYYPNENYIVITIVSGNMDNRNISYLGFFSIIDLNDSTKNKYKDINESIDYYENQKLLKMFENRILNPLKKQIKEDSGEK